MSILNFLTNKKDYENIIYILDRLLQVNIDGEAINKTRNIDLNLYKILNNPKVNQEIIHLGCLPIIREGKEASNEFIQFINNLSAYMEYDINTDFLWAKTTDNQNMQEDINEKMYQTRKEILQYLFDKKLMSDEQYVNELEYEVKSLNN